MSIVIYDKALGAVSTNAYLVGDTDTGEAILIDPVDDAQALVNMAEDNDLTIKLILATHAHFDHVLASQALVEMTGAPFYIHEEAAPYLDQLPETGVRFTGKPFPEAAKPDKLLQDNEIVSLGSIELQALYTPGHAPGHLSFWLASENVVFGGDAIFAGAVGRTDLEGGDLDVLMNSIENRIMPLGDDVRILPGHGMETTVKKEAETNPFIVLRRK